MMLQRDNLCMGIPEGQAMLSDFIPNGLLPNEATSVTRVLDPNRWSRAEERTVELIEHIQPNQSSEECRNAVASYVQCLIMKCCSCQVFTFGSVPLKTYLPDGDIDLTAFSNNKHFKDSWAHEVRDILESEEKSVGAEFHVKEVQYIQAEVKIIKCLVDNIVVDISFSQLGGLCTLCFLEEVDNLISQNHLFKRSIILIKAWCFYESRILGAHHGLISTYALETLVLYIFHVYNNTFAGPLEVLYRFLEFFSKFDWDNYCLSLWGPVPIGSLPNLRAVPPRKDCGELLLSKLFLNACTSFYGVMPSSQENQEEHFVSKYFNIIDPLRANNNLGRSVSKGNFFRIRSAFALGAQRLVRLLDCPEENLIAEFDLFFRNTRHRHGEGHRPDAPSYDLHSRNKNVPEYSTCHESEVEQVQASNAYHLKKSKQMFGSSDVSAVSQSQSQKTNGIFTGSITVDIKHSNSVKNTHTDGGQSPNYSSNEVHVMRHFVSTLSNPEFAHISVEVPPQPRVVGASETERGQSHSESLLTDKSKRSSLRSKVIDNYNDRVSAENQPSSSASYGWRKDDAVDSKNASNSYLGEFGLGVIKEDDHSSDRAMLMHQEEHDFFNNVETYRNHLFNGNLQATVGVNSDHLSSPVPPPILASGYTHANSFYMLPANVPSFESFWGYHVPYSQSLVPFPALQSLSSAGMTLNLEEITEPVDDNLVVAGLDHDDHHDGGFWAEQDVNSVRGYNYEDGNIKAQRQRHREGVATVGSSSGNSSWLTSSGNNYGATIENRWLTRENYGDDLPDETTIDSDVNSTASSRSTPSLSTSRTKLSSCSSLNESPSKDSKLIRDQGGIKIAYPPSSVNKGQYEGILGDHISSQPDDDSGEWIRQSTVDTFLIKSTTADTVTSDVQTHQSTNYGRQPMTVSNSTVPDTSVLVGPGSSSFYQARPPVPFLTMVPLYNIPAQAGTYTATNPMDTQLGNLHAHQSSVSLDTTARLKQSDTSNKPNHIRHGETLECFEKQRFDILNGDFASHWKNLQYGQFCQNAQLEGSLSYSPSFIHSMYLQGQFPWDGSGVPLANINIMGCSHLVPMIPTRHDSDSLVGFGQHFADEHPRYSGGTGTYLPNPRFYRSRHYSDTRNQRGNHNYNRKDGERERNWNFNSKPRFAGRGQFRYQVERSGTRMDKTNPDNRRSDRPWNSFKHGSFSSHNSHNGSFNSSMSNIHVAANLPHGMHPLPIVSAGYNSNELPEFGISEYTSCTNEASHQGEGTPSAVHELANFEGDSTEYFRDQHSSPNWHRVLQD